MYAIRNKRTKRWLYGTWHQDGRIVQRTATDKAMLFDDFSVAKAEFEIRRCGKNYEIVPVRLVEMPVRLMEIQPAVQI